VELHYAVHTAGGAIDNKNIGTAVASGWTKNLAVVGGKPALQVSLPDGTASYVLTYQAQVISAVPSGAVSNEVVLTSTNGPTDSSKYEAKVSSNSWGWLEKKAIYKFVKADEFGGKATPLEGVVFNLYSDVECKNLKRTAISNSQGIVSFYGLDFDQTYYYKEDAAPKGYKLLEGDAETGSFSIIEANGNNVTRSEAVLNNRLTYDKAVQIEKTFDMTGYEAGQSYPQSTFKLYMYPNGFNSGVKVPIKVTGSNGSYNYAASDSADAKEDLVNALPTSSSNDIASGQISIIGLPWGCYGIEEVTPGSGFAAYEGMKYFSIDLPDAEGETALTANYTPTNTSKDIGAEKTISNEQTQLTIHKTADTGHSLAGAVLSVYGTDDQGTKSTIAVNPITGAAITTTVPVGEDNEFIWDIKGIPAGTYYLCEDTAPTDQVLSKFADIKFSINVYGKITILSGISGTSLSGTTITVKDETAEATLKKLDQFGQAATNAQIDLEVYDPAEKDWTKTGDTWIVGTGDDANTSGQKTFTGLDRGVTYRFRETQVPAGYLNVTAATENTIQFHIDEYGNVVTSGTETYVLNNVTDAPTAYANVFDGGNTFTMRNERIMGQAQFTKVSVNQDEGNKKSLSGAVFDLYKVGAGEAGADLLIAKGMTSAANGLVSTLSEKDAVTNAETKLKLNQGLTVGNYYFKETKTSSDFILPEGDNAKVSFEVKSDGSDRYTWRTVGSNSADHVITASGPAAANKPNVVLVTLKKTDAASTDGNIILVTGAAYRLTGKDINGNSISKDAITRAANSQISYSDSQGNSYTYTTKDDGEAVFTDIPRSDENGYTIREITPAPGYTLNSSTWNTGVVSNNTNNTTRIIHLNDLDGAAAVTDTKTNLTINKADDKDAALKGATFTVTPASGKTFANGSSEPISILSGEATDTLSGKLVAGVSYTITETKEPDGAATLKPFTVTCNANGTFTLNKGGNAANDLTLTHDAATGNNTIKAVNHLSITGTKTWADDSNAYGTRPTADAFKSSLGLYIDYTEAGKADEKVTDAVFTWNSTAGNTWTYTISGISPAPEGASYVVKETVPANYTETSSGTVSVQADGAANANKDLVAGELTNTLRKTKLDVQKTWVGPLENNALPAGYLPDSVKVQVQRTINKEGSSTWNTVQKNNAALILEVSGSTDPAWKVTVSDLPATDAEGHPYYYRAVETELIYDSTSYTRDKAENVDTNTIGAFSISETPAWNSVQEGASFESSTSITNTLVTNGMEASKTWTDADDQDGVRPTSVTFYLLKDKVKLTGYDKTVNADSSWKAKWTNLPSKQIDGTDIEYSVEEAEVESYTTGYEGNEANGYTVTNTHTPALVNKTVTKNWSDGSNKDLTRPASLKVTLYGTWTDDEKTAHKEKAGEQTIMAPANSSNAWTYEFKNLPKYKAGQVGKEITYSVEEEAVPGYTLQAVGDDLLNMTNTADTMSISVKKTWNDAGNTNRPDTTLWLQQSIDGGKTWTNRGEAKTLAKQGDETISYPDLPVMYQAATNYQYRVVEKTGTNYVPVLDGTVEVNSETNVITATSDFITAAKDDEEQIDITNNITQTQIAKKDTNGDYLSGAHFKLEGTLTDGSTSYEWTSGNTAETFVRKLKVDTEYTLTETSPADGYEITSFNENFNYPNAAGDGKSLTLKEDKTGKLFYKLAEGNATEWAQMTDNLALIKDEQTNIQIQKVDTADEPLEGTSFELSGTFVTGIQGPLTWTSDENAESITGKLIVGNVYTLTETNPSPGYQMAGTVKIKYITDEGWKMSTDDGASWDSISGDLLKIENENNSFTLKKVDEDNTPLEDSSFTIKGKFTDTPSDSESSTKELLGTGKSSETLTGKLISDQEYEIKETTPTDGYTVMKPFTVTMGKDGNISLVGEGRADVNISSNIVTAKNTQTDISIKKVDDSDPAQQIGGAKLKLEGTFADDTNEKSWESKADESYNLKGLVIVGETYTLTETERMTGYLDFPGAVTFKVTDEGTMEITANPNGKDETAAASLSDDEKELAVRNVKALGIVTLQKIDADTQLPINDVIFALYDNEDNLIKDGLATGNSYEASDWSATDATDGKLTIAGLDLGSYYLQEIAAEGYQVSSEKHNFTIDNDNGALDPSVDLVTIENKPTELSFDKTELYVETCSDPTLGDDVLSPALERPLAGAEFTAYSDKECSTLVTKETSNLNGRVTFKGLAAGTYWIKETSIPDGHDQSAKDDVYEAHFASNGTLESFGIIDAVTDIAAPGITTKITNDVLRTDIVLNKVSETDPNKKLPDSTYGLFVDDTQTVQGQRSFAVARMTELSKVAFTSGLKLIAKAKTDENGMLRFNGILVGRTYVIQELEAPDGSLVSKNPITLKYEVDEDGVPQIKLTDDGSGTAVVDPETGEVVWLEPPVQVSFDKKDEDGKLLAGARLQVVDTNGNIVAGPWTSSAESGNVVEGVLTGGETYKLQELQAPEGYDKAADVEFVVDDTPAAHGENRIQHVTMVDPKTVIPTSQTTSTSSQQNTSGTQTTSTGAKTSDAMGDTVPMMVMVMLAAAFAGTMAVKRMRRQHRR
ncbi:MAG: Cna B-type domain-containing protein, partial [Clostridia bacterium]|nr:Cna B-type domain-containing protein [Clostridia bacterium]